MLINETSTTSSTTYRPSTLIEAQGTWLKTFAWDWFFNGTFRKPVTAKGAKFFLDKYVESLRQLSGKNVNMYWVVERSPGWGNVHTHALIGNVGTIQPFCGCDGRSCRESCGVHLWRCGIAQVSPYSPDGAAAFYISKNTFFHTNNVDFTDWGFIGRPTPIEAVTRSTSD